VIRNRVANIRDALNAGLCAAGWWTVWNGEQLCD